MSDTLNNHVTESQKPQETESVEDTDIQSETSPPVAADQEVSPEAEGSADASTDAGEDDFDAPVRGEPEIDVDALIVNLDGYEGPLDILLELARTQKVDIRKISMVTLVDQYLTFIEAARRKDLELAADYLVMASWLTFLKSKLLIPKPEENSEEPTADEMAARLAFQLQRLEAMRKATEALFNLPRLGINVFPRGCPEGVRVTRTPDWQADLFDMLKAYTTQRVATVERHYKPEKPRVFTLEDARARLSRILGAIPEWSELRTLSPLQEVDAPSRSVVASAFHAALEFAKEGRLDLRQLGHFEPIYVRNRQTDEAGNGGNGGDVTNLPPPNADMHDDYALNDTQDDGPDDSQPHADDMMHAQATAS